MSAPSPNELVAAIFVVLFASLAIIVPFIVSRHPFRGDRERRLWLVRRSGRWIFKRKRK